MSRQYFAGQGVTDATPQPLPYTTFEQFVTRWLSAPTVNHLSYAAYHALSEKDQRAAKVTTYFCTAVFKGDGKRRAYNIAHCQLLCIDVDKADAARTILSAPFDELIPWPFALWTTLTSTEEKPRIRLIIDTEPLTVEEYRAGVSWLAARLGVTEKDIDPHSFDPTHLWFKPSVFSDQEGTIPMVATRTTGPPLTAAEWSTQPVEDSSVLDISNLPANDVSIEDAESMLTKVDPDEDYWRWIKVLCALKHQFGPDGLDLFDDWSRRGEKYPGREAIERKWKAFSAHPTDRAPVTIKSLIQLAREKGWEPDASNSVQTLEKLIAESDRATLTTTILERIHKASLLSPLQEDTLLGLISARLRRLGAPVRLSSLRTALDALEAKPGGNPAIPAELQGFIYVREADQWVQPAKGVRIHPVAFDRSFSVNTVAAIHELHMPVVDREGYEPRRPGDLIYTDASGVQVLNTYRQSYPEADPARANEASVIFNEHLSLLFPSAVSRDLLLSWMSWCLLHPGEKVRWHVFIQGAPGCGKSLIAIALGKCFGDTNVRKVTNQMLTERFNKWIGGSLFAYFEEILLGDRQKDTMEVIKDIVTGTTVNIRAMRQDYIEQANMLNGLFLSNHLHGLRLDRDDRRFFVLCCAQQHKHQVEKMSREHFARLARLQTDLAGGLRYYLLHRKISPAFDEHGHAPLTPDRELVLRAGASEIDAAVVSLIEEADHVHLGKDVISATTLIQLVRNEIRFATGKQLARVLVEMGYLKLGQREIESGERHSLWYNPDHLNGSQPLTAFNKRIKAKEIKE